MATARGHDDCVIDLLKHGANIEGQDADGNTPLIFACLAGNSRIVQLLLKNNANVEVPGALCRTALHFAGQEGQHK